MAVRTAGDGGGPQQERAGGPARGCTGDPCGVCGFGGPRAGHAPGEGPAPAWPAPRRAAFGCDETSLCRGVSQTVSPCPAGPPPPWRPRRALRAYLPGCSGTR